VYEEPRALKSLPRLSSVDRDLQGYRSGHNLAGVYVGLGELSKAEQLWRQVVEEAPWFAPAWHGLVSHPRRPRRLSFEIIKNA
jgi:hypothetical protein